MASAEPPHRLPIDGVLDLHSFHPRDVKPLIAAYIEACQERGLYRLRIIHGKGTGALRETVRQNLGRHPDVRSFRDDPGPGSWGATLVDLRPAAGAAAQD